MSHHRPVPVGIYTGEYLREVAFPLGGIGTGCVSLEGRGALRDWEIFNRPNKGSLMPATFAALWCHRDKADADVRAIVGPPNRDFIGSAGEPRFRGVGFGLNRAQANGLPHFASARFHGSFPFARITFHQPGHPLQVELEAFSPFIPLDEDASGMPVACLTYRLANVSDRPVNAMLAFSMFNGISLGVPADPGHPDLAANTFQDGQHCRGLVFTNDRFSADHPRHGSMALSTDWPQVSHLPTWMPATGKHWWEDWELFWRQFNTGRFTPATTSSEPGTATAGSLGLHVTLTPGEQADLPVLISWCFPNFLRYWNNPRDLPETDWPRWTNAYARHWPTAWDAASDFFAHRDQLLGRTHRFEEVLFGSTLPAEVIESVSATASTLRTPTCLRLEDGTFWGWEGCHAGAGCCEGSCTHVWNYALTQAYLFPALHRSMRRSEYQYSFDSSEQGEHGAVVFRIPLPLGQPAELWHAAIDGQLGGVVQLYRDWRFSGDDGYLRAMWPGARRALQYAWHRWDVDRDGLIEKDQHNTYDINFHGPNPLAQFFYLAALKAGNAMARHLGDEAEADEYERVHTMGRVRTEQHLFNGDYFVQLLDGTPQDVPPHQHGIGCLSDQVFGQLMATVAGLGDLVDPQMVRNALDSIVLYNLRDPLGDHANLQRIYMASDESGLLLCSWPHGGRVPTPFPYSDEAWTGIEYQVATHLLYEDRYENAMRIVRAVRARHDGCRRNPFNEFECGSHYARALASWGLLLALSGFRYDAVNRTLHLHPRGPEAARMRCFFSTGSAWGRFTVAPNDVTIDVIEGSLELSMIHTPIGRWLSAESATVRAGESRTFELGF